VENQMRTVSAKNAKYNFGELIDKARASPVTIAKYGRPVVVVMAVEEFERLTSQARGTNPAPNAMRAGGRSRRTTTT
jgi:prevent-host-death family protein